MRAERIRTAAAALLDAAAAPGFKLPMLHEVATEAMGLVSDPNVAMNRLERVIIRDGLLAARVLRIAGSPAYGGQATSSLTASLQRLGATAIRDIVYQSVMECQVFRGADQQAVRGERDHGVAVGRLAKGLSKLRDVQTELGFICGLLHDIGRLAMHGLAGHRALSGLDAMETTAVHSVVHTSLGARMTAKWGLPEAVTEGVRRHHRYRGYAGDGGGYSPIGHLLNVADAVVGHLGIGRSPKPLTPGDELTIREFGVEPAAVVEVARQAFASGI